MFIRDLKRYSKYATYSAVSEFKIPSGGVVFGLDVVGAGPAAVYAGLYLCRGLYLWVRGG